MICLTRMKRILEINTRDRYAIVEPGVVNVWLTRALAGTGFHYAPDPSSQTACTIGGNVATNSGGPAHAQVRRDGQPRPGRRAGPARRLGRRDRRRRPRTTPATT